MTWIDIGALDADNREWQLSQSFIGNLIKIENEVSSPTLNFYRFRGLIGINYDFTHFFELKIFYSDPISQIFLFPDLPLISSKYIAIKNISKRNNNNQWTIRASAWQNN